MTVAEFERVYRQCAPLVHARARRMLDADADDVVQDVFAQLWRRPPAHGELLPWLYRASTNACLDRLRARQRRDPTWEAQVRGAADGGPRALADELASKELCRRLIVRADDKTQQVVALVYFDDATHDDAAALLGVSRKTIGERIERFHDLARKVIQRWQT